MWLYWRTRNPEHLALAKRAAELNRQYDGVAAMIHDKPPPGAGNHECWHIHANLMTVRGFP